MHLGHAPAPLHRYYDVLPAGVCGLCAPAGTGGPGRGGALETPSKRTSAASCPTRPLFSAQPNRPLAQVDVRSFNRLAPNRGAATRSAQLWQVSHRALSAPFAWATISLPLEVDASRAGELRGSATVAPTASGTCHAVCVWIDFGFGGSAHAWLRTGPTGGNFDAPIPWAQGLVLLEPCAVRRGGSLDVSLNIFLSAERAGEVACSVATGPSH